MPERRPESRTTTIEGTPLRWLEQPASEDRSGVPVVLVHGIPTSSALWRHVVPLLPGLGVLVPEMTGYGDSIPAGAGRDIGLAAQADRLLAWLDGRGVREAVLVGHDLGGGVVQIMAVRRPELCAGLLLTNAVGYDSWPVPSVKVLAAARGLVARLPGRVVTSSLAGLFVRGHDNAATAAESRRTHMRPYLEHGAGPALARQVASLDVRDTLEVSPRLAELRVPARVMWGDADPFQKVEYGERFADDLRVPLHRIEGGRHFTPEDHPDVLAAHVLDLHREVVQRRR
ncbi:alpha/beta fold hydrolase [Aquipuribacter nitratireducens]|uniref:Alpha/beta fold hydrolase n=1 Tax=Aquipuribacter nitratireducens TaxID=650104 RepID=A0ABW0GQU9_9MICO